MERWCQEMSDTYAVIVTPKENSFDTCIGENNE